MTKRDPITGGYVYLTVDDIEYRVYVEEAGVGIPLLLQHTAGSDGRQYRHLLCDPEVTSPTTCPTTASPSRPTAWSGGRRSTT